MAATVVLVATNTPAAGVPGARGRRGVRGPRRRETRAGIVVLTATAAVLALGPWLTLQPVLLSLLGLVLTLYLLCALGGGVLTIVAMPDSPVLGASGAIFGLFGVGFTVWRRRHLVLSPRSRMKALRADK